MEEISSLLIQAAERKSWEQVVQLFSNFSISFTQELDETHKKSIFSRIFQKSTTFERGIETLKKCAELGMYKEIGYVNLVQSLTFLFSNLMAPASPTNEHRVAFATYLQILESISGVIKYDGIFPLGKIILNATFFVRQSGGVSQNLPKDKNTSFTQELVTSLMKIIENKPSRPLFWWCIICSSIVPVITYAPDTYVSLSDKIIFNFKVCFDLILELISTPYGQDDVVHFSNRVLRIFYFTFLEQTEQKDIDFIVDVVLDSLPKEILTTIFSESCKLNDSQSVGLFLKSFLSESGKAFINQNDYSPVFLKAKHHFSYLTHEIWRALDKGDMEAIADAFAEEIMKDPDSFLMFSLLLLCYESNLSIPERITIHIGDLRKTLLSSIAGFSCIMACAFGNRLLMIDSEESVSIRDCSTYLINMKNSEFVDMYFLPQTRIMIRGILVTDDKRPKDECFEYIDRFFSNWEKNNGLLIAYGCFVETLVSISKSLPYNANMNVFNIFSEPILKFMCSADSSLPPECLSACVTVTFDICLQRGSAENIPPAVSTKLSLCLLRLLSLKDETASLQGVKLSCDAILSGNPVFMTTAPFLIEFLAADVDLSPTAKILSTLVSISTFFSKHENVSKSIITIETRAGQLLSCTKDDVRSFATSYFKEGTRFSRERLFNGIEKLFLRFLTSCPNEKVISSAVVLIHNSLLLTSRTSKAILSGITDKSVTKLITNRVALSFDCLTDIAKQFDAVYPMFLINLTNALLDSFFKTRDISKLHLLLNLCIASRIPLNCVIEKITSNKEVNEGENEIFLDIIMQHVANLTRVMSPAWNHIELISAEVLAMTNSNVAHVVQNAGDIQFILTSLPSNRAAYSFKLVTVVTEKEPIKDPELTLDEVVMDEKETKQFVNDFELFKKLREQIIASGKEELLSSPNDIQKIEVEGSEYTSPITSEDSIDSLNSFRDRSKCNFDSTLGGMAILGLFGRNIAESPFVSENADFRRMIGKPLKPILHVPIIYWTKNANTVDDAIKVKWSQTSELFKQFTSSLGQVSKNGMSLFYSTWGTDIIFEIAPLLTETTSYDLLGNSLNKEVQLIWFEKGIIDSYKSACNTTFLISQLRTGLIKVDIKQNIPDDYVGPLGPTNIVSPESLPSLLRATIATAVEDSTKYLLSGNILKHYKSNQEKMKHLNEEMQRIDNFLNEK